MCGSRRIAGVRNVVVGHVRPRDGAALLSVLIDSGHGRGAPQTTRRAGVIVLARSLATPLGPDVRQQCSQRHIVLKRNAITDMHGGWIRPIGNLRPVLVGYVHEILEEGPDVQRVHPFLPVRSAPQMRSLPTELYFLTLRRTPYCVIFWALSSLVGSGGSTPSLMVRSVQVLISFW